MKAKSVCHGLVTTSKSIFIAIGTVISLVKICRWGEKEQDCSYQGETLNVPTAF